MSPSGPPEILGAYPPHPISAGDKAPPALLMPPLNGGQLSKGGPVKGGQIDHSRTRAGRQGIQDIKPPPPGRPAFTNLGSCGQAVHVHRPNVRNVALGL
jgi:hypothetical protein